MVEQGLNKSNNKGFTLIELLIAMIIVIVVMLGLLKGILEYEKFTTRAKMKDKATEIARQFTSYIENLPYVADYSGIQSILYANNSSWNNVTCKCFQKDSNNKCINYRCTTSPSGTNPPEFFETETDFYSIGSPTLSNPIGGLSSNLRLYPSADTNNATCSCSGSNCPTTLPPCTYQGFSGRRIYSAVNIARMVDESGTQERGKAVSVMVWYFEPFTNELKTMTSVVIKERI